MRRRKKNDDRSATFPFLPCLDVTGKKAEGKSLVLKELYSLFPLSTSIIVRFHRSSLSRFFASFLFFFFRHTREHIHVHQSYLLFNSRVIFVRQVDCRVATNVFVDREKKKQQSEREKERKKEEKK